MMRKISRINRREFLKGAAAAAGAVAFPTIIPASSLGRDGATAPSNRITMGAIGVGGMGNGDLHTLMGCAGVQYLAVCDVDRRAREGAKSAVDGRNKNNDCKAYNDFRELLARDDIDAVLIAVPDHWHGVISVAALKAGKDVYGEKPLARTIREGRAICDAVQRYGRVWQTGSQQRSDGRFRHAAELVRNGRIGKVSRVEVGLPGHGNTSPNLPPCEPPEWLDWDFWLGPAPWRPFQRWSDRAPVWDWRWVMDFSGGQLTDWAGHHIDIALWGMGLEHTGPVEIEGKAEYPTDGVFDTPGRYSFDCTYADGLVIHVASHRQMGAKWIGDKGWIWVDRGRGGASDPKILKEQIGPDEVQLYRSNNHCQNFIDCVRSRRPTVAPAEAAHRSISVGLLGEIAMLVGRKIRWNPEKEEIIGDETASRMLGRAMRSPWHL